ncbi:hypothetical protein AAK684_06890 [Leptogranulimonas caecicola]|nr:hypothetical protein ATOBIA_N05810 [Atopobiaceae bacterium P1]
MKYEKGKTYPAPKSYEEAKKIFAAGAFVSTEEGYPARQTKTKKKASKGK